MIIGLGDFGKDFRILTSITGTRPRVKTSSSISKLAV